MNFFTSLLLMLGHQLLFSRQEASALKLLHLTVPAYTPRGETAHLECSYDLENDELYSVTWYKDNEEFYKYEIKSAKPKKISHSVEGVNLNYDASDNHKVMLENVNLKTRGDYRCEVTADVQNFPSVQEEKFMEVVVTPQSNPRITGEEEIYANGDILNLNCTSGKSNPPAQLTWFINDVMVDPDSERLIEHQDLLSMVSSLRLKLGPDHVSTGQMTVRCEALVKTSDRAGDLQDLRVTHVFVQGNASMTSPNTWLLALLLLHRIALLLR